MPYKDPIQAREHSKLRQRTYCKKPGVNKAYAERMRKLREDPEFVAQERAQQKMSRTNPETRPARLKKDRERRAKCRYFFNLLKIERGCYDCGGMFPPEALDFDHLPGKEKCFNIAKFLANKPCEEVLDEISKCQVVCATCHRIRTATRKKENN